MERLGPYSLVQGRRWRHRNTVFPYMCYHTKIRRSRSNSLRVGRVLKLFWDAEGPLPWELGRGCGWPLETRYPHVCYRTKIRRSNRLGVRRRFQKFGDPGAPPLWTGAWLTPRNMLLPPVLPCQIRSRSNRASVILEICQKILTSRAHLSRSLKTPQRRSSMPSLRHAWITAMPF